MKEENNSSMRTGFQEIAPWAPEIDLQSDFVMVYGLNETLKDRIRQYREKGYQVCVMTGCAWGSYGDYLEGNWDGQTHWEEAQTDRNGKPILHGINTPYMVPTISFGNYLAEQLKLLVAEGVAGIFMEEPEFWEAGGYSVAFQREYWTYYGEPWEAPHASLEAAWRCARLKRFLYARLLEQLAEAVKTCSRERYGREMPFFVATHSLLNYTQWKIISPESRLLTMKQVDGFIAQVWSGTSGTGNVYEGHYKSRTFETAYLEYGIAQELVRGTERKLWFLQDPVEDFPDRGWESYRKKYVKTLVAALFWPAVHRYEVCPWPNRVFNGRYPRKMGMAEGMIPTEEREDTKDIPPEYATLLAGMVQLLGTLEQEERPALSREACVGILMSDTGMFQRSFPDVIAMNQFGGNPTDANRQGEEKTVLFMKGQEEVINRQLQNYQGTSGEAAFYAEMQENPARLAAYTESAAFPFFFGLAMPLLKYGLPIRPVSLERITEPVCLEGLRCLILSYEGMKPELPVYQEKLVSWVKEGGCLIYVGDGSDPYHQIPGWWKEKKREGRADICLFEALGLSGDPAEGVHPAGKGRIVIWKKAPALLTAIPKLSAEYRNIVRTTLLALGVVWKEQNFLEGERGPYCLTAVMTESCGNEPHRRTGLFTDLLAEGYPVIHEKVTACGEESLLFDYEKIRKESCRVIASAAGIKKLTWNETSFTLSLKAVDRICVYVRIRLPFQPEKVEAQTEDGGKLPLLAQWEEETKTMLFSYHSTNQLVRITGESRR